jgi:Zn-dependent protease
VYASRLAALAAEAEAAETGGRLTDAAERWRDALALLPPDAPQTGMIAERLTALARRQEATPTLGSPPASPTGPRSLAARWWATASVAVVFVLTKAKLLLLGFTKLGTLLTMLASVGLYWTLWGWRFALGFVLSIYVHEMGHVSALSRYGIRASAPMFIPGIGAVIRARQPITDVRQDARVGLAGPLWGLGAGLACYGIHLVTGSGLFAALGQSAAWLNLFNLLPVYPLDGGRGFRSLTRLQRWVVVAVLGLLWGATREGLLILLAAAALFQVLPRGPEESDTPALLLFLGLLVSLTALAGISVPTAHP